MAKTKFFRIAVEGETVDGRTITRDMIQQAADSYNPATYTARINCEHLRGYSPEGPFNAWGSVDAVKAEQIDLQIGGKTEKRLGLFASFDVTEQAKAYNQAGQKIFSSMEIQSNFAGTGKAYLVGLAVTDSPASLGTEVLKFSRDDKRKDNMVQVQEFELAYEAEGAAGDAATGAFASMKRFFDSFTNPQPPAAPAAPAVQAQPAQGGSGDPAGGASQFTQFMAQFSREMETMSAGIQKGFTAIEASVASLKQDHEALKADIEKKPDPKYSARPLSSGGSTATRAEC